MTVTLVAAVERGLNEHELGAITEYGIDHPAVRSVAFQPVTHSGRHVEFDPLNRLANRPFDVHTERSARSDGSSVASGTVHAMFGRKEVEEAGQKN
ncbi:hypothetical protein ACL02U_19420 [Streptomyces sp. MS06]|uniref:hypothetical protein n=1 Tax=Streptomyces sp. MS06 TaxID=3385974 RepID=UPI000582C1D5